MIRMNTRDGNTCGAATIVYVFGPIWLLSGQSKKKERGRSNIRQCTGQELVSESQALTEKEPRQVEPPGTIHTRAEGPTVQLCGDSNVAEKSIDDH